MLLVHCTASCTLGINSILTSLQNSAFIFAKDKGSKEAILTARIAKEQEREIDTDSIKSAIDFIIIDNIFSGTFPRPFIASAERTGISTFRKELNFARSQLLKEMAGADYVTTRAGQTFC